MQGSMPIGDELANILLLAGCYQADRLPDAATPETALVDLEALVHRCRGGPVGVTCLRRLDRAVAGGFESHSRTRHGADSRGSRSKAHGKARGRGRADSERRGTEFLIRECPEGDGLAPWRDLEALVDRRRGRPVGITCLL